MTRCIHHHILWRWETLVEDEDKTGLRRMFVRLTGRCEDCEKPFRFCGAKSSEILRNIYPDQEFPVGSVPYQCATISDDGYEIRIPMGTAEEVKECSHCEGTFGYDHEEMHDQMAARNKLN